MDQSERVQAWALTLAAMTEAMREVCRLSYYIGSPFQLPLPTGTVTCHIAADMAPTRNVVVVQVCRDQAPNQAAAAEAMAFVGAWVQDKYGYEVALAQGIVRFEVPASDLEEPDLTELDQRFCTAIDDLLDTYTTSGRQPEWGDLTPFMATEGLTTLHCKARITRTDGGKLHLILDIDQTDPPIRPRMSLRALVAKYGADVLEHHSHGFVLTLEP